MKPWIAVFALTAMTGCGTQPATDSGDETNEQVEATRQFLEQSGAESMDWLQIRGSMEVVGSNEWFAEIETDDGRYLLETDRPCRSLTVKGNDDGIEFLSGRASSGGFVRRLVPGVDYIRNCRIAAIYDLNNSVPDAGGEQ